MTPAGVFELVKHDHTVCVQSSAGDGSGFFDEDYKNNRGLNDISPDVALGLRYQF